MTWRDILPPDPAANLLPLLDPEGLRELADDVEQNGLLVEPIITWEGNGPRLLDGRNRLDAMELAGYKFTGVKGRDRLSFTSPEGPGSLTLTDRTGADAVATVISANIHRRHLTIEQRRDLTAELVKLQPEKSDRQIAKTVGVSHPTVGKVRRELEEAGDVERITTSTDTLGRVQPRRSSLDSSSGLVHLAKYFQDHPEEAAALKAAEDAKQAAWERAPERAAEEARWKAQAEAKAAHRADVHSRLRACCFKECRRSDMDMVETVFSLVNVALDASLDLGERLEWAEDFIGATERLGTLKDSAEATEPAKSEGPGDEPAGLGQFDADKVMGMFLGLPCTDAPGHAEWCEGQCGKAE